ncbi:TlpA family protein disulfide reductase [Dysgonomonas capnocytophagoides]|uniref:TlpA family protein disulfide reductase n=1 Tax=Dysgonomonas capnocytophagoides TaxID=45254 RepID=A0A4Y8L5J0_9BACT|nr:TlpA disulfide reductase family protein [Dysgonomonas capnocytophagoides]TFD97843.1 TlpA family protein disulfide reductase [Dysgonomonas capnocytophagoides]
MKNNRLIVKVIEILFLFIITMPCYSNLQNNTIRPEIKLDTVKLSGKITDYRTNVHKPTSITLTIYQPISGNKKNIKAILNENRSFELQVETEISTSITYVNIEGNDYPLLIDLHTQKETILDIEYNKEGELLVNGNQLFTSFDIINTASNMTNMILSESDFHIKDLYLVSPDSCKTALEQEMDSRLYKYVTTNKDFSTFAKEYQTIAFKLFWITQMAFNIEQSMNTERQQRNNIKSIENIKIDKMFYSFLKELDLNNPLILLSPDLNKFIENLLFETSLKIPLIKDTPIDIWLSNVKYILSDIIGFDEGLFYDLLAANAYSIQMKNTKKPLNNKQRKNIREYFHGNDIEMMLFKQDDECLEVNQVVINRTPTVNKEELMSEIITKYKGNVVLVDFWATWCGSCLMAIDEFSTAKNRLKDKGVTFVYLTDETSPFRIWEQKIQGIGDEHYYLTTTEWNYIKDSFGFISIPCYLLYDQNGKLYKKFKGYPNANELEKSIRDLL